MYQGNFTKRKVSFNVNGHVTKICYIQTLPLQKLHMHQKMRFFLSVLTSWQNNEKLSQSCEQLA